MRPQLLQRRPDVREAETAADDPAIAEQALHFVGVRAGPDVEVLRATPQQQIAYAAPYEVGLETGGVEAIEHLERIGIDVLTREGMFAPGDDYGLDHGPVV